MRQSRFKREGDNHPPLLLYEHCNGFFWGMGEDQWDGNCTVTLVLRIVPQFRRGKCCFFFCFFVFGSVSLVCFFLAVFLFLGSLSGKSFRERTFVFGGLCCFFVFLVSFCLGFDFMFWRFAPETVRKNSRQVFCFGFVLSFLGFSGRGRFCLFFFVFVFQERKLR